MPYAMACYATPPHAEKMRATPFVTNIFAMPSHHCCATLIYEQQV